METGMSSFMDPPSQMWPQSWQEIHTVMGDQSPGMHRRKWGWGGGDGSGVVSFGQRCWIKRMQPCRCLGKVFYSRQDSGCKDSPYSRYSTEMAVSGKHVLGSEVEEETKETKRVLTLQDFASPSVWGGKREKVWAEQDGMSSLSAVWKLDSLKIGSSQGPSSESCGFSSGRVRMWELDHKESWAPKNWCFWTVVLEKTLEFLGLQGEQTSQS